MSAKNLSTLSFSECGSAVLETAFTAALIAVVVVASANYLGKGVQESFVKLALNSDVGLDNSGDSDTPSVPAGDQADDE